MTQSQQNRVRGFNASLSQRGGLFIVTGTDDQFSGINEPATPENAPWLTEQEMRSFSFLCVLRDTVLGLSAPPTIGDIFYDVDDDGNNNTSFRVTKIDDNPQDIKIRYHCEVAPIAS